MALYVCRAFEQAREFRANAEIAEFGWFAAAALPAETSAPTRQRIAEVLASVPQTEAW